MKRFSSGILLIVIGIILINLGFFRILNQNKLPTMTDQQIIERARQLGMVELKEKLGGGE